MDGDNVDREQAVDDTDSCQISGHRILTRILVTRNCDVAVLVESEPKLKLTPVGLTYESLNQNNNNDKGRYFVATEHGCTYLPGAGHAYFGNLLDKLGSYQSSPTSSPPTKCLRNLVVQRLSSRSHLSTQLKLERRAFRPPQLTSDQGEPLTEPQSFYPAVCRINFESLVISYEPALVFQILAIGSKAEAHLTIE
jgi:hypothetical protein